jgi:hypothetical protein
MKTLKWSFTSILAVFVTDWNPDRSRLEVIGITFTFFACCQKKITLIKLLEDVKSDSSRWVKTKGESYKQFYWQGGYGAFSVSPYEVDTVRTYIRNQHEHHKTETYQDEYRRILRKNEIDFDERFIWD